MGLVTENPACDWWATNFSPTHSFWGGEGLEVESVTKG